MNGIAPEITNYIFIGRENNGLDLRSQINFYFQRQILYTMAKIV